MSIYGYYKPEITSQSMTLVEPSPADLARNLCPHCDGGCSRPANLITTMCVKFSEKEALK